MWPDRVSNPGPLTYESGALPTALRGPAFQVLLTGKVSQYPCHKVKKCEHVFGYICKIHVHILPLVRFCLKRSEHVRL